MDWNALADVQLSPASLVAGSRQGESWEQALDAFLGPLELAWRAVDERTIQITSRAVAHSARTIEFYPVADLVARQPGGAAGLIATLEQAVQPQIGSIDDVCHFEYDAASGHLLVLAPAEVQRQLAEHLAKM